MDPIRTYLGRLLLEEITPVVMVITTPLVEEACQKNGFSFVDMLLPFSLFPRIDGTLIWIFFAICHLDLVNEDI
jgi:trafficking protein particle complex subunit 8